MRELIQQMKTRGREEFISFMQKRKALIESIGKEEAEKQLLEEYNITP